MILLRAVTLILIGLICADGGVSAQQRIGGRINDYTPVRSISVRDCHADVVVEDASAFTRGNIVLIIQMKGVTAGGTYDVSAVGRFEFGTVDTVIGTTLRLTHPLIHTYDVRGRVQCVRVPVYPNVITSFPITGDPWNGRTGGVIAMDVRGTLRLEAPIDASGLGFRGGTTWVSGATCSTMTDHDGMNSPFAAMKGETYVDPLPTQISGRQALFSGAGGGCAHNSGGGGGGNAGNGGLGGAQWEGCGAYVNNGGRGGLGAAAVVASFPMARVGGGGGAGQMNNSSATAGANGGGIIIIRCATLDGNGQRIYANGASQLQDAGNDAAGGGGAGGTVLLETGSLISGVFIEANGGNGGNVNSGAMHGPGGGGGGGAFIFASASPLAGLAYATRGGANGQNVVRTSTVERNYLSERGADGTSVFGRHIPEYVDDVPALTVTAPADTVVCPGTPLDLLARTTGRSTSIEWRTSAGTVVSTTARMRTVAQTSTTYIVEIVDANGCRALDSVFVGVGTGWTIAFPPVRRTMAPCELALDDALWLYNNSSLPATITQVRARTPGVTVTFTGPVRVEPGERLRIPVRVTMPVNAASFTGEVEALITPCDTIAVSSFIVDRNTVSFDVDPDTVIMPSLNACNDVTIDTTVGVTFRGGSIDVIDVIVEGAVQYLFATSFRPAPGFRYQIPIRWVPTIGSTSGRIGFIIVEGSCRDTAWIEIDGRNSRPQVTAPRVIDVPVTTLCRDPFVDVSIPIRSQDTTQWTVVDINMTGPVIVDIPVGTRFTAALDVMARVTPATSGPYSTTISLRLQPCDSVVEITIRGAAVDTSLDATPLLVFTEPTIGRTEVRTATYVNTGTASLSVRSVSGPQAPFAMISTIPAVPCILAPGERLTVDVELVQTYGRHRDSLVVDIDAPCVMRAVTALEAEATALTRVLIPDVAGEIGIRDTVFVLLTRMPEIDPSLLSAYAFTISWTAADCAVDDGSGTRGSWTTRRINDTVFTDVSGVWDGSDTLAVIPVTPLLSPSTQTDLRFVRDPGFRWIGQMSNVEYDDGTLTVNEPCAGRDLRSVRLTGTGAITVAPHPLRDALSIRVADAGTHDMLIELVDLVGSVVWSTTAVVTHEARFQLPSIAAGTYGLRFTRGGDRRTTLVIVE